MYFRKKTELFTAVLMAALLLVCSLLTSCTGNDAENESSPSSVVPQSQSENTAGSSEEEAASSEDTAPSGVLPEEESSGSSDTETDVPESQDAVSVFYPDPFVVTGADSLNVRIDPGTDAAVLGSLPNGYGGNVVSYGEGDGNWLHITSGALDGYVHGSYVVTGQAAKDLVAEKAVTGVRISADTAILHTDASIDSPTIAIAKKGSVFMLEDAVNGFCVVHYGERGYAYIDPADVTEGLYIAEAQAYEKVEYTDPVIEPTEPGTDPGTVVTPGNPNGITVCIDAGHQQHGISDMEPNAPGSSVMKAKLTTGTQGCATGIPEYEINLEVSLRLQAELQARGYNVIMIRTTNDCPMSNAERAVLANQSGANCFIRIHCNSMTDPSITGIINYAPSAGNPWMTPDNAAKSILFAQLLADHTCAATGAINRGVLQDDTMTGINWCQIPVAIVEMGFMSNPTEDMLLADPSYQTLLAAGMANAIDAFFGR